MIQGADMKDKKTGGAIKSIRLQRTEVLFTPYEKYTRHKFRENIGILNKYFKYFLQPVEGQHKKNKTPET